jgi:hypothetical protein
MARLSKKNSKRLSSVDNEIASAYFATLFVANLYKDPITLRHEKGCRALDAILKKSSFKTALFITAWNPMSVPAAGITNKTQHDILFKNLIRKYKNIYNGAGIGESTLWSPEHSYLVLGPSFDDSVKIAKKFNQAAFGFYSKGRFNVIFCGQQI